MNLLVKWGRACLGFLEILPAALFFFYKLRYEIRWGLVWKRTLFSHDGKVSFIAIDLIVF